MSHPTLATPAPQKVQADLQLLLKDLQALHTELPDSLTPHWAVQRLRGLEAQTEQVPSASVLQARLLAWCDHPAVQGWIETSDAVHELVPGTALPALRGSVLSADLARPDAALRVRTAASGWSVTVLRQTEPGAPGTEPVLVRGIEHAGIRGEGDTLRYCLAQSLVEGTLRPVDAWFVGFGA
jgi:hypothetical protein